MPISLGNYSAIFSHIWEFCLISGKIVSYLGIPEGTKKRRFYAILRIYGVSYVYAEGGT